MAKFELFHAGSQKPLAEFDGEYLELNPQGQSVCVMANDGKGVQRVFAVIRLAEGQNVKKVG